MKQHKAIVLLRGRARTIKSLGGVEMLGNEFKL
jgi:hypothetical protein